MKYTQGNWYESQRARGNVMCGDRVVANCNSYNSNMTDVTIENYANAALIAAAPEMYEAIKSVIETHIVEAKKANFAGCACSVCCILKPALAKAENNL